jgi:hypothetical protein
MEFDLEDVMETLRNEYGVPALSKKHGTEYVQIPKAGRKDFLRRLANTGKDQGMDKEYFKKGTVQTEICRFCFPDQLTGGPGWDNKKRIDAYKVVQSELNSVIREVWPAEISRNASVSVKEMTIQERKLGYKEYNPADNRVQFEEIPNNESLPGPIDIQDDETARFLGLKK